MLRILAWCLSIVLAVAPTLSFAQSAPIFGFPPGAFQSRGALDGGAGAAYSGPGDVVASALAWWGARCYSGAYSGNVADIWDAATGSTTETLVTCSAGGTLNQTINSVATTCASGCKVKTLYDQSGNTNCSGACNVTQSNNAFRPAFTQSGCTGLSGTKTWCIVFTGTEVLSSASTWSGSTVAQPYTITCATRWTNSGSFEPCVAIDAASNGAELGFYLGGNAVEIQAGTVATTVGGSQAINNWYSVQGVASGASSSLYVNGTATTGLNAGAQTIAAGATAYIGGDTFSDRNIGMFVEGGVWPNGATSQSSLESNIRTFWGF